MTIRPERRNAAGHMTQSKTEWRRRLLALRAAIPEERRRLGSDAVVARLRGLRCLREASTVLGYVAIGTEVQPAALFVSGLPAGARLLMPSARSKEGSPVWVPAAGPSGRDAPGLSARQLTFPVVAIVPGVGFDRRGTRLGRGGGFYDRALADLRAAGAITAIGLAYELQIVEDLPRDAWDEAVDIVVSEARVVLPRSGRRSIREAP
ncbi:MAG: 5-formyltetrahydrofolate cyclo-ligase [Deltaproteobacteria bacterium]|nr:5-formyltetrahydrofolate cyclo-ligase [Deltaproteobacteria bacterium]